MILNVSVFRDTKKSHNAQLRAACEAALKEIQEMVGSDNNSEGNDDSCSDSAVIAMVTIYQIITGDNLSISSSVLPDPFQDALKLDADKYFLPFR